jgi:DNA-binding MurR/RpiR family transcriptional regulator
VVVGISRSGTTIDTVYTLERAKEQGSKTIAVTHRGKSPINRFADISLLSSSAEGPLSGGATPGKVGQLLIIDVLYRTLLWKYAEANEAIHRTATAVSEKNY